MRLRHLLQILPGEQCAEQTAAADCLQPPLLCGFRQQLSGSVGLTIWKSGSLYARRKAVRTPAAHTSVSPYAATPDIVLENSMDQTRYP